MKGYLEYRELLQYITKRDKALGESLFALLKTMTEVFRAKNTELAEAQAEMKRLHKERNRATEELQEMHDCLFNELKADAEIGRLVRGMPDETALRRIVGTYRIARFGYIESRRLGWKSDAGCTEDPAEALRSIQEAVDAEG